MGAHQHIILGEGLGELFFGMSRADIRKTLGDPSEIETYEYLNDSDKLAESWHYDTEEISLTFYEEEADWQLETIAISSSKYKLEGVSFVGMSKNEAIAHVESLGLGSHKVEYFKEDDQTLLSLPDQHLIMWIENDEVQELQWEPMWDEDWD